MLARLISLLSMLASGAAIAQVSVQEYPLPSGVGVHDVWADAAPGGPVWFSAQRSGHLGILDPSSGKVTLVPLGENSSPHGVVAAADGAPWLTDGGQNAIVRVDPKTREVKAWPLPQRVGYANLNTAIFDGAGIHGTDDIGSLGSAASHGCVRMAVPDVIDLYDRVDVGTPVYIQ